MLFVNLDLILELLSTNILKKTSENKLKYYDLICDSTLEKDIKLTEREKKYIDNIISNNGDYTIYFEREKELFTKLLVSDYLRKNGYDDVIDISSEIDLIGLFKNCASTKLKNDKDFAGVMIGLDGSYISIMGEMIKNNRNIMIKAISNDTSLDVSSFINTDSRLKKDPDTAILYLKKLKLQKQDKFIIEDIYNNIFKQVDGKFVNVYFKENEQASWLEDPNFLTELVKVDSKFMEYIINGKISRPITSKNNQKIK